MSEDNEQIEAKRKINLITRAHLRNIEGYSTSKNKAVSRELENAIKKCDKEIASYLSKVKQDSDCTIRIRESTIEKLREFSIENFPGKNSTYDELLIRLIDLTLRNNCSLVKQLLRDKIIAPTIKLRYYWCLFNIPCICLIN
jgi:hypothetical protein